MDQEENLTKQPTLSTTSNTIPHSSLTNSHPNKTHKYLFIGTVGVLFIITIIGIFSLSIKKENKQASANQEEVASLKKQSAEDSLHTVYYVLYHTGTVSGYMQSQNPDLAKDNYSEVYSLDTLTKKTSLLFSDKKHPFSMPSPDTSNWLATSINKDTVLYFAENRKFRPQSDNYGSFFVNLLNKQVTRVHSLQNTNHVSTDASGTLLAYTTGFDRTKVKNPNSEYIITQNIETKQSRQLIDLYQRYPKSNVLIYSISLSPDGKTVAVVTQNGIPADSWQELLLINTSTGNIQTAVEKKHQTQFISKPYWKNNDELLFIGTKTSSLVHVIFSLSVHTMKVNRLFNFPEEKENSRDYDFTFTDNGNAVVYLTETSDHSDKDFNNWTTHAEVKITNIPNGATTTLINIPPTKYRNLQISLFN